MSDQRRTIWLDRLLAIGRVAMTLRHGCGDGRTDHECGDLPSLEERVRELVLRKAKKLAPHASTGKTRVLLVETLDLVNMNEERMLNALKSAFGGMPDGIDQLWFVDNGGHLGPMFVDFTPLLARSGPAA